MRIRLVLMCGMLSGAVLGMAPTTQTAFAAGANAATQAAPVASIDEMSSAQKKRTKAKRSQNRRGYSAYGRGNQIACTAYGCRPIPRGCRIVPQRTWDWTPTGFDDVICPYR